MKKILGLVISLTVISGVCAGVLAYVDGLTRTPIAETKVAKTLKAAEAVMPQGVAKVEAVGDGAFVGLDASGAPVGYAVAGSDPDGYGGTVELMVGFEADRRTVVCYKVLAAAETPGLGMKLSTPDFFKQFTGRDGSALKVKKDGGDVEAITAATITSRAVCRAIGAAQARADGLAK